MTFEIAFLCAVLLAMVALFLSEWLPVEVTAFSGLAVLIFTGYLAPDEAFTGFSSPAVITMLSVFLLSGGLQQAGVAERLGTRIHALGRGREVPLIVVVMLVAGALSAFMNNVAAVAVLLPAISSVSRRAGLAPTRLFMPLAFGAILGGTTTLVGTPPNILTAEVLAHHGVAPFELFDFTPLGLVLLGTGVLFMVTVGRRLLPEQARSFATTGTAGGGDLPGLYRLREHLFSLHVPAGSPLAGRTLRDTRLGTTLAVQVVALVRGGRRRLAPDPDTELREGDLLLVEGELDELRELLALQGIEVEAAPPRLTLAPGATGTARLRVGSASPWAGHTLAELRLRQDHGLTVARIDTADTGDGPSGSVGALAGSRLEAGDEVVVLGTDERIERVAALPGLEVLERGPEVLERLEQSLFLLRVPPEAPLVGQDLRGSRLGELVGVTVLGLVREGETRLALEPDEPIEAGDRLLAAGEPARILALLQLGSVEPQPEAPVDALESEEVGMIEAVVAPRSKAAGKSLAELSFRERNGLQVLAIWRDGTALHRDLAHLELRIGDALLLQGPRERFDLLGTDGDFVVLSERVEPLRRPKKAPFALAALALMVGLVVTDVFPIHVAAFAAAVVVLLSRALTMEEGYRFIEWRAIFLVAAILPMGIAMDRSGAAVLLAETVTATAGGLGPTAVLVALVVLASALSQGLDGAPTVVLLGPVVFHTAEELGVSPYPLMMGVGLAASAAFMTPFSHKANLLVMGAGTYRVRDYLRVGTPLTVLVLLLLTLLVPVFFPF